MLSGIMVRHKFSFKNLLETLMEISFLTFSKSFPSSIKMSDYKNRMVLGPVLLLFLLTSIQYCNLILDNQVKKIPDKIIESWEDLALLKNVAIFGLKNRFMSQFVEQDNDMARNFKKRFKEMPIDHWLTKQFCIKLAKNISTGNAVFVINKLTLVFFLMRMAQHVELEDPDFLDHVLVSRYGSADIPYFIPSFNYFHHPYHQDLNKM